MKKIWEALKKPFTKSDIEWRVCRSGITNDRPWIMCLCYVTNRAIMDRLDEIVGAENWKNEFKQAPEGGVLCGISIRVDSNGLNEEWITKWDGAENTEVEATKGGLSSAMKRAAVQWGIGRYLYRLEENFADVSEKGEFKARIKDKKTGEYRNVKWSPPILPNWAIPSKGDDTPTKHTKPPKTTKIQPKKTTVVKSDDSPEASITTSPVNIKTEVDYGVEEKDISISGMADESLGDPYLKEINTLEEMLDNPPKAFAEDGSKKSLMIDKIMKMSKKLSAGEWEVFIKPRIGDRGLVNLPEDDLIKFGTELRDHLYLAKKAKQ